MNQLQIHIFMIGPPIIMNIFLFNVKTEDH